MKVRRRRRQRGKGMGGRGGREVQGEKEGREGG